MGNMCKPTQSQAKFTKKFELCQYLSNEPNNITCGVRQTEAVRCCLEKLSFTVFSEITKYTQQSRKTTVDHVSYAAYGLGVVQISLNTNSMKICFQLCLTKYYQNQTK